MSTAIWPPIPAKQLTEQEDASLAREMQWLLESLQETLQSLKGGLDEVAALLAPADVASTLVLSSHRSESLKGFISRLGTRIVKGDIKLRLPNLPPPRGMTSYPLSISTEAHAPTIYLEQLSTARTLINACLDVVDASAWAGNPHDATFIAGQLRLLDMNLQQAKAALKGSNQMQLPWYKSSVDHNAFTPPLPDSVAFHLTIQDAAIVVEIRTLDLQSADNAGFSSSFSIRDRLGFALGTAARPTHDEVDEVFSWKNQQAKVRDKIRVETSDPSLMAALAKLTALERTIALSRKGLNTLMGTEEED